MKKFALILLVFLSSVCISFAQEYEFTEQDIFGDLKNNIEEVFKKVIKNGLNKKSFDSLNKKQLWSCFPNTQIDLGVSPSVEDLKLYYPLYEFGQSDLYKNNIGTFLNSSEPYERLFAYRIISVTGDTSLIDKLVEKVTTDTNEVSSAWAGISLLFLKCKETTLLFDFLVNKEDLGDAHFFPFYLQLDKDSLKNTAFNKIGAEDLKSKIISIQTLSKVEQDKRTEAIYRKSLSNWETDLKGYALMPIIDNKIGNIQKDVEPLLLHPRARRVAISALINSPVKSDRQFLYDTFLTSDSINQYEFVNIYFEYKDEIKDLFGALIKKHKLDKNSYLYGQFEKINNSKSIGEQQFAELFKMAEEEKPSTLSMILPVMAQSHGDDQRVINFLSDLLEHPDLLTREVAAKSLKMIESDKIIPIIISTFQKPEYITESLIELAIVKKLDTLHSQIEKVYNEKGYNSYAALKYISTFPRKKDKQLFKSILTDGNLDKYDGWAAIGLAKLEEKEAFDLISKNLELVENSYYKVPLTYLLEALSLVKEDEAKAKLETYLNSSEYGIPEVARELLDKM